MNNTSQSIDSFKERKLFSPNIKVLVNAIYAAATAAGVLVNFITVLVFWRNKALRRPFNLLLLNLFVADMMFCLTLQPFIWIDFTTITEQGKLAGFICAMTIGLAFPMICMAANSLSILSVTLQRYLSIVHNITNFFTTSINFTKVFCTFTWISGIVVAIPNVLSYKYDHGEKICYREWPKGINGTVYSAVTTSVFLVALLLIMVFAYVMLALRIWMRHRKSSLTNSVAERAKKSITVLLGLLILAVIVCWTPLFMVWLLGRSFDYFPKGVDGEFKRQRWLRIGLLMGAMNPVVDPIIYAYSSSECRTGLRKLFRNRKINSVQAMAYRRPENIH